MVGSKYAMAGWVFFAGILMVLVGSLDVLQGLIALFEDEYFVATQTGFLVVDLTGWGWIMLIWGIVLALAGLALMSGKGWARWFTVVVVSLNIIGQLGFVGSSDYPLWALTVLALNVIILYAVAVRWKDAQEAAAY